MNSFVVVRRLCQRSFGTTTLHRGGELLPLDVHVYKNESAGSSVKNRIFICHGLFGSGRNLGTLANMLARELDMESHSITLRNHGASGHSPVMTFDAMANDVLAYVQSLAAEAEVPSGDSKSFWLGHSLGGKVLMYLSLLHPQYVSKAVFVDIAPISYEERFSHLRIAKAMADCDLNNVTSLDQVEKHLLDSGIRDLPTRKFLLLNLRRRDNGKFEWRHNAKLFAQDRVIAELRGWPASAVEGRSFTKPVLFVRGAQSEYMSDETFEQAKRTLFPNSRLVTIPNAGHWVHAEQPRLFASAVVDFFKNN